MTRALWCASAWAVCLALCGCGGGKPEPKKYPVSGIVNLDGKPLADGRIIFKTPDVGAFDTINIKDGQFQGQAQAGKRRVEISAYRESKTPTMYAKTAPAIGPDGKPVPGMEATQRENYLPARYNTLSQLSEEVKSDGPNQFKFDLRSK